MEIQGKEAWSPIKCKACGQRTFSHEEHSTTSTRGEGEEEEGSMEGVWGGGGVYEMRGRLAKGANGNH